MVIASGALIETVQSDDGIKQKSRQFFCDENVNIIFPREVIQLTVLYYELHLLN